jgi:hypothetical protein
MMAHKPPRGFRSVSKLDLKRSTSENSLTKDLDSVVGFMRWLAGLFGSEEMHFYSLFTHTTNWLDPLQTPPSLLPPNCRP